MENNRNLATETKARLESTLGDKKKEIELLVSKAATDFAQSMTTFSVVVTEEEAREKWGKHYHRVLDFLRKEGFVVEMYTEELRTGFLGMKKTTAYRFKISVLEERKK